MNHPFDPKQGPVLVIGVVSGPTGATKVQLVVDTGATNSLVSPAVLESVGYNLDASTARVRVAMGNGVDVVPRVIVNRFTAFGSHRIGFPLLAGSLPPEAGVDGLLGLDFLRGHLLTLDFRAGVVTFS